MRAYKLVATTAAAMTALVQAQIWTSDGTVIIATGTNFNWPAPTSTDTPSQFLPTASPSTYSVVPTSSSAVTSAAASTTATSSSDGAYMSPSSSGDVTFSTSVSAAAASRSSTVELQNSCPSNYTLTAGTGRPISATWTFSNSTATHVFSPSVSSASSTTADTPPSSLISGFSTSVTVSGSLVGSSTSWSAPGGATTSTSQAPSGTGSSPEFCPGVIPYYRDDLMLSFDDLPQFDGSASAPIFNPHNALSFSSGFSYRTPPFTAHSLSNVAYFQPNESTTDIDSSDSVGSLPGEITSGPDPSDSRFWFNTHSLWLTCDAPGDAFCSVTFTMFEWHESTQSPRQVASGTAQVPPCSHGDCGLWPWDQAVTGNGLIGFQIEAAVNGEPVPFYLDDFSMTWYDTSCEAAQARVNVA